MNIKPLKTEKKITKWQLKRVGIIFDASPDSKDGDEAEILSMLVMNNVTGLK